MTLPLAALGLLSLGGGYFHVPAFLGPVFGHQEEVHDAALVAISVAAGLAGILLAWLFYVARPGLADVVAARLGAVYKLVYNKYFVDEVYGALVVRPVVEGSRVVLWQTFDDAVIDGTVNGVGARARNLGGLLRRFQSGNIRSYAAWVLAGSVLAIVALALGGAR